MTVAVVLGVSTLTLVPGGAADAVVVRWGLNGGTAPNYQADVNGDFLVAGNGVLACDTAAATGYGTCAQLHQATSPSTTNASVNDAFRMINSNSVAGFTTNSSSASLTVPAGAQVVKAFLNWSANTGTYSGQTGVYCGASTFGTASLPSGAPTGYRDRAIQFKVGSGAIQSYSPYSLLEDATTQATSRYYSASADVTSAFASVPTGSAVTLSAGNIWAPQGPGCYAGWSVTVVYDFGSFTAGNAASVPHRVIYYEGHVRQGANDAALTVDYAGFTAVDTGTRAAFTLYEGDRGIAGDTASYRRGSDTAYTEIPNSAGATGNFGIGRGAGSVRYTQTQDTSAFTNQSVDVLTQPLSRVVAGDSSVRLQLATTGDSYLLTNSTLSVPTAGLKVEKTFDGTADNQFRTSGERATFTIRLTNSGAGTLTNISAEDDQAGCDRTLSGVTLAPGQSTTYTCTATANTSATYTSTVTATATTVQGGFLANGTDSTTVTLSAIGLTKSSTLAAGATGRAGEVVNYSFTATNTGGGTLTGVAITDPLVGLSSLTYAWPGTAGTLAAGQSVTATATRTLTQADVDAGSVVNTASTVGTDADGGVQPTATAANTQTIAPAGSIAVTKSGVVTSGGGTVGSSITWAIRFTNSGNVTLTGVTLSDSLAGLSTPVITWPGTAGRLAPGQSATAAATSTVTQAQVDAGQVVNTATVNGTTPLGATITGSSGAATVSTIPASPGLAITKTAQYTSGTGAVGSVVRYSFSASNTGNVTLSGVAITDPLSGLGALTYQWPGSAGVLAPGQVVTATASYTVTQADVDRGSLVNRATVAGTSPSGAAVSAQSAQVTTPTVTAAPAVTLTKSGVSSGQTVGSTVTYTFTLTNSGNVTLTGATITDPLPGLSPRSYGAWPSGTAGTLRPGDQVTATSTYTLTQADVDAGSVVNTATATATPPSGANVTQTRSATIPITPTGAVTVTKTGAVTSGSGGVGSTVTWTITARNSGNVTLTQVAITDSLPGISTPTITWPGTPGTLTPGQTATATATSTITQAQLDNGQITNTATTTARTPQGATTTGTSPTATVTTAPPTPSLALTKSSAVAGAGGVGDAVTYTFVLRNTGNVTISNAAVTDPLPGLSALTYTWPGTAGALAPGQSVTATATYALRQADVNSGSVTNTASATGRAPSGSLVTAPNASTTTATAVAAPGVVLTKTGALAAGSTGVAGDTVNWSFTIRNTGNVTLTAVQALERTPGVSTRTYSWPGTAGTLQPGQTATATATSQLTQTDVDAGSIVNTAYATATPPAGPAITSADANATIPLAARGTLTLTKTPSTTTGVRVDDTITYTLVARNTGNVTLTDVTITDPLPGLSTLTYGTWPTSTTGTLRPGDQITATATYRATQTDINNGQITNRATTTATTPQGATTTAQSPTTTVTTIPASPGLAITKTAQYTSGTGAVGSVIAYTITARNPGNVTLTDVTVTDPLSGLSDLSLQWPGATGILQPGAQVVATGTYTVTQADVNRGSILNQSAATGRPPAGAVLTAQSATVATPTAPSAPNALFTKTGTLVGPSAAGSTVEYAFLYRNTGNVTLSGVAVSDPQLADGVQYGEWPGATGVLQPGQEISATAVRTVTQSDVDAGAVVNTATATGTPPGGSPLSRTAAATVPLAPGSSLSLEKSATYQAGAGEIGSVVRYSFTLTNTGATTLTGAAVSDTLAGLSAPVYGAWPSGTAGTLRPGDAVTATATRTITQSDVDTGSVTNVATAQARTLQGAPVTTTSAAVQTPTADAAPSIVTTKSAAGAGNGAVGSVITYTIRAENTGNVTLRGVAVADPLLPAASLDYGAWPSGAAGVLRPGDAITVRAAHVVTQAEVDAGSITNVASAVGTPPTGPAVSDDSDPVLTPLVARTGTIALTHDGALPSGSSGRAGDVVSFTYRLTNTGTTTLTGVELDSTLTMTTGPAFGPWPGPTGVLAPGQSVTATATYVLTQADVDAGTLSDPATASGTPPTGVSPSPAVADATATVPIPRVSTLSIDKSGALAPGAGAVGTDIVYSFVVRNTGTTTLTAVDIADGRLDGPVTFAWPGAPGVLLPRQEVAASGVHVITADDFDAGTVANTATASAASPLGPITSAPSSTTVTTGTQAPGIVITKALSPDDPGPAASRKVGDVVEYSFTVRNTGNVTLDDILITDPLLDPGTIDVPGPLVAGAAAAPIEAPYTVTQADLDRGFLLNTARVTASAPLGATAADTSNELRTPLNPAAELSLDKTPEITGDPVAGAIVTYTFTLTNTGDVTVSGATITDPLVGGEVSVAESEWAAAAGTLAPGASVTTTADYTVSQADVDAGSVVNTATAAALPASGGAATRATDSATTLLRADDELTLEKTADVSGDGGLGDEITYTFVARNSGTTTLSGVSITDPLAGLGTIQYGEWPTATDGLLRPGTSITATATLEITQAVLDAGVVRNTASARAASPDGDPVTATSETVTVSNAPAGGLAPAAPALGVSKTASQTTGVTAGTVLTYTVAVSNTGNVTVSGITLTDTLPGLSALSITWPGTPGALAPEQTATATATYRVTQADVDSGSVVNTVTANGTGAGRPGGTPVNGSASATSTAAVAGAALAVTDAGALAAGSTGVAGDTVEWTYVLSNAGNITLTGVTAAEIGVTVVPGSLQYGAWPGAEGTLAPGQSVTVTARSLLTQAQVDAGTVTSTVRGDGVSQRDGSAVQATRSATVEIPQRTGLDLVKTGALAAGDIGEVGDRIEYTLSAVNTGNVTLHRVDLIDRLPGLVITSLEWPADADGTVIDGVIPPGTRADGTGYVIVTQAHVDAGRVNNQADVQGFTTEEPIAGEQPLIERSNPVTVPVIQAAPQLTTTTSAAPGTAGLGTVVTWTSVVTNTGNVSITLNTDDIVDAHAYGSAATFTWSPGTTPGTLAPGQSVTMVGTSAVTQAEVDAGTAVNSVVAVGAPVRGPAVVLSNVASAAVVTTSTGASIDIEKSIVPGAGFTGRAGSPVVITYTVTNTGALTLTDVAVTESASLTGPPAYAWPAGVPAGTLRPGDVVTATATHLLTQAEVDAAVFASPATSVGTAPASAGGLQVSDTDAQPFPLAQVVDMDVTKAGRLEGDGTVGTRILYDFSIENTGNATLTLVDLVDSLLGVSDPVFDWPDETRAGVVLPGETATATGAYTITQADVDRGSVSNTATASGKPPLGDTIYRASNTDVTSVAAADPDLLLEKAADPTAGIAVGSAITYTITATNTGNQTLTDVAVDDLLAGAGPLIAEWPATPGTLLPGQAVEFTTTYVATQQDVDAGSVTNTADAVAVAPSTPEPLTRSASATSTAVTAAPSISVSDSGALAPGATGVAGDEVVWTYVVTNDGNVTLTAIELAESLGIVPGSLVFGDWPSATGTLAPAQSVTATARYVLTQADVDAGSITSTVSVQGDAPSGSVPATPTDTASDTVAITARPGLEAVKRGAMAPGATGQVGERVLYSLEATNTGNVTLYDGFLEDRLPGLVITGIDWPVTEDGAPVPGLLPPGASVAGRAYVVITQADVDRGFIRNVAGVYAFTSETVQDETTIVRADSNAVTVPMAEPAPLLVSTSAASLAGTGAVDDVITWTHTLANAGNVSIRVNVADYVDQQGLTDAAYEPAGPTVVLAPGATLVLRGTSVVTQSDVDAGSVVHTATGFGTSVRDDSRVDAAPSSATVILADAAPALVVTKDAAPGAGFDGRAGSIVEWSYTLRNSGTVTLTDVELQDALADAPDGVVIDWGELTPGTLPVGATITATAQHRLTQAEVDGGRTESTVTATGVPPRGAAVSAQATAGLDVAADPAIGVSKVGTVGGDGAVGDTVTYAFRVENEGNVTLTLVDLVDALPGVTAPVITWPTAATGVLLPGDVATVTASYEIGQADFDRGTVVNRATATGLPPVGDRVASTTGDVVTTIGEAAPALEVVKDVDDAAEVVAGQVLAYTITVRNAGDVTLTSVEPEELLADTTPLSATWPEQPGVLAPDESATFRTSYRVTQADIDAGSVTNTVRVSADPARGALEPVEAAVTSTAVAASAALTVDDSGVLAAGATGVAGDAVDWTYEVTNTGNVTLTGVGVAETGVALVPGSLQYTGWPAAVGVLLPGQSVTATARSLLTQAQVDEGVASSIVTASGTTPAGTSPASVSATDEADVTVQIRPGLEAVKSGALVPGQPGRVGDRIDYSLTATNTGNVTLYRGALVDPLAGLVIDGIDWPVVEDGVEVEGLLPPGASVTGRGHVLLTQADIDRGYLENTARVAAYTEPAAQPGEQPVRASTNTVRLATITAAPQLRSETEGALAGTGVRGETITWTHRLTNTGNVTIELDAADYADLDGLASPAYDWSAAAAPGRLAPGESLVLTGTSTITQADVDRGSVTHRASGTGTSVRDDSAVASNVSSGEVVLAPGVAAVSVTDAGALASPEDARQGGTVVWSYRVTNTGTVTLTGVEVADRLPGIGDPQYTWTTPTGILAPGDFVDVRAEYTLTQADVDAGSVVSLVTATGLPPRGAPATADAAATVEIDPSPTLEVVKTGELVTPGANGVGDWVRFEFVLRNLGNVTLTDVTLADSLPGLSVPEIAWPGDAGVLRPGGTATATAMYELSQPDVDRGEVRNIATLTGLPPVGVAARATSGEVVVTTEAAAPAMTVTKGGALLTGQGDAGSVVRFTFAVLNSGNTTLSALQIDDRLPGVGAPVITYPAGDGTLVPGATATAVADYVLTQEDVDRGYVDNIADASADAVRGTDPEATSNTYRFTTRAAGPGLTATQTAAFTGAGTGLLDDEIRYEFRIRNSGNVTLTDVQWAASLTGLRDVVVTWPAGTPEGSLAPGDELVITGLYSVTQADVDRGEVRNDLTGRGTSPTGVVVDDDAERSELPLVEASPSLLIVKSGELLTEDGVELIRYTFRLVNTGEVTLRDATVVDELDGLGDIVFGEWPTEEDGVLRPGDDVTATADYVLTQADIDAGSVDNIAEGTATAPDGSEVADLSDPVSLGSGPAAPAIDIEKEIRLVGSAPPRAGSVVQHLFTVTNNGRVTLTGVTFADDQARLGTLSIDWPGEPGVLAPGESATAVARYTLTQADVDAGAVSSTATTTGSGVRGGDVRDTDPASLSLAAAPALTVDKTATVRTTPTVGQQIDYRIEVRNTGNVTLGAVAVTDQLLDVSTFTITWPGTPGQLAPDTSVIVTGSRTITTADVAAGAVANTASARGQSAQGVVVQGADAATVAIPNGAAVTLAISAALRPGQAGFAGDTVTFTYIVTNTGTVPLSGVQVQDPRTGLSAIVFGPWPGAAGELLPGESVIATATYVLTPADEGTDLVETATVTAVGASPAQTVSDDARTTLSLPDREPTPPVQPGEPAPADPTLPELPPTGVTISFGAIGSALALILWGVVLVRTSSRRKENR